MACGQPWRRWNLVLSQWGRPVPRCRSVRSWAQGPLPLLSCFWTNAERADASQLRSGGAARHELLQRLSAATLFIASVVRRTPVMTARWKH